MADTTGDWAMEPAGLNSEMLLIGVIGVVIVVIILQMLRRKNEGDVLTGSLAPTPRKTLPAQLTVDRSAILDPEVRQAMASGNKIVAIKRYRELTGVGLKEAKDVIEYAEANPAMPPGEADVQAKTSMSGGDLPTDAGIRELIRRGQKIQAIKAYREFTGVGLAAAKAEIERMEQEENLK